MRAHSARWRQLVFIAITQVLVLGLWFATSAVSPALRTEWGMSQGTATWLTNAVQLGFVAGAVLSAALNLPDRLSCRVLIAASAALGAAATVLFVVVADSPATGIPLRFLTGMALAGVYPPGMKLIASWFDTHRGLAIGVVVGGLTLGSGSPHAIAASGNPSWKVVLLVSAGLAIAGAVIALALVREGPLGAPAPRLQPAYVVRMLRDPAPRGRQPRLPRSHVGALCALGVAAAVLSLRAGRHGVAAPRPHTATEIVSFVAIGVAGAVGAVGGGLIADRIGRPELIIAALAVSGICCVLSVLAFGLNPAVVACLALVWGVAVIADSAQFSAALTELTDVRYTGTALTAQTAMGFLLTVASIRFVPWFASEVGWRWALMPLAIGPALGILAIAKLVRPAVPDRALVGATDSEWAGHGSNP